MLIASTVSAVGHYCGRFEPGFFGEPLNSFSNVAFVVGAAVAWHAWRRNATRDPWQLLLFALAASIGVGSFIFHSMPTPVTLMVDLVPIQVFGLTFLAYACVRYLGLSIPATLGIAICFFFIRQGWIIAMPRGALGGGITHIPSLVAVLGVGGWLVHRRMRLGWFLLGAGTSYVAALLIRSWDLYLCSSLPLGVHWVWHLLTALTTSLLVYGVARMPPNISVNADVRERASVQGRHESTTPVP